MYQDSEDGHIREFLIRIRNHNNDIEENSESLILTAADTLAKQVGSTGIFYDAGALCFTMFAPSVGIG